MKNEQQYVIVGQRQGGIDIPFGLKVYRFCETDGSLKEVFRGFEWISAGQICVDQENGLVYAVNEKPSVPDIPGGGSEVYAFRFNAEKEELVLINRVPTHYSTPSYPCMDKSGKYLLVSHNASNNIITKEITDPEGRTSVSRIFDEAALILIPKTGNGSLGDIADAAVIPSKSPDGLNIQPEDARKGILAFPGVISHLHSVAQSPDGNVTVTCDFGLGKIYVFSIDRENGKLNRVFTAEEDPEYALRYCAFHPELPYLYVNCEKVPLILCYRYNINDLSLEKVAEIRTLPAENTDSTGSNDIVVHPDGKFVYCSNIDNMISVLRVEKDGKLSLVETVSSEGNRPRALQVSLDGRFLIAGNNRSQALAVFAIADDGTISFTGNTAEDVIPSGIRFLSSTVIPE